MSARTVFDGTALRLNDEAYEMYIEIGRKVDAMPNVSLGQWQGEVYLRLFGNSRIKQLNEQNLLWEPVPKEPYNPAWPTGIPDCFAK